MVIEKIGRERRMRNTMLRLVLTCLAASAATASLAAPTTFRPFGVSRESLPSALHCSPVYAGTLANDTGQYICNSLPEGEPAFQQYILAFVKGVGICNVSAVTPYIDDDRRGTRTRALFRDIGMRMESMYGPPDERVDHAVGVTSKMDDRFKRAIISEERQIFDQWNHLGKIDADADSASLAISGSDELGLAVYSVVRFAGNDACMEKLEIATGTTDAPQ